MRREVGISTYLHGFMPLQLSPIVHFTLTLCFSSVPSLHCNTRFECHRYTLAATTVAIKGLSGDQEPCQEWNDAIETYLVLRCYTECRANGCAINNSLHPPYI
jgi:hypothetical protein